MNSVAIPASAPAPTLSTEADLARSAARGNADAFSELFRRHGQPSWRLAQAVAPNRDAAAAALRDGFSRAARSRRTVSAGGAFRPVALAAVYKAALEQAQNPAATPSPARRAPDAESALADAAFRSLPERWRAAVWLSDVEGVDPDRISAVLGVSAAVATQLVGRGRKGLAGRFAQAHHAVPDHLGEVLRSSALAMPAGLAESTRARWAAAGSERVSLLAPVSSWIEEHAARPASVAVGTLVGLGLIGLGVIPQGSPVRSQFNAGGAGSLSGAVPVQTCMGLPCSGNTGSSGIGPAGGLTAFGTTNPFANASTTSSFSSFGAGGSQSAGLSPLNSTSGGPSGAGGSTSGTGGTSGGSGGGGGGGGGAGGGSGSGSGGGTGGGSGGGSPATSPTTTVAPTVNLAPVATVTNSGSSLNVTLLPSSPASTTVSVPLSTAPSTTTTTVAPTTTTTTTPLSGVTNTVTNTVTSTATTLLPGL